MPLLDPSISSNSFNISNNSTAYRPNSESNHPFPPEHQQVSSQPEFISFKDWNALKVSQWMQENGFQEYKDLFLKHEITGDLLLDLNYNNLGEIGIVNVGERARIIQAIKKRFAPLIPKLSLSNHFLHSNGSLPFSLSLGSISGATSALASLGSPHPLGGSQGFYGSTGSLNASQGYSGGLSASSSYGNVRSAISKPNNGRGHSTRFSFFLMLISFYRAESQSFSNVNQKSPTASNSSLSPTNPTFSHPPVNTTSQAATINPKKMQNISLTAGDLKSTIRAEREAAQNAQAASIQSTSRTNLSNAIAVKEKEKGKILSRLTSVKKTSNSGTSTPQEELFQAVDSIFGGTTQAPTIIIANPNNISQDPSSPKSPVASENDIMNMKGIREVNIVSYTISNHFNI